MKTFAPEHESILTEAQRITHGDRGVDYGHPHDDLTRTAGIVNALLKSKLAVDLTPSDMALIMICVKMSREVNRPKRDNRVDIAGFSWVLDRCQEQQAYEYVQTMHEETSEPFVPWERRHYRLLTIGNLWIFRRSFGKTPE